MMSDEPVGTDQVKSAGASQTVGIVQGVTGPHIVSVGLLDLRGVPAEQVAQIRSIRSVGAVLVDEGNRHALSQATVESTGGIVVVEPGLRVMVEPFLEISKATLDGMPAGQKLMLVGIVFFKPDVPPALIAEKFEDLRVVGVLFACAGAQGALLGRMQSTGVSITLPDDVGAVVRSLGENRLTPDYLAHLQDNSAYLNIGATFVSDDVTEALLAQKVQSYYNIGATFAPAPLLALLKARCPTNLGHFGEPDEPKGEALPADASSATA
jgi:hypothetical protein